MKKITNHFTLSLLFMTVITFIMGCASSSKKTEKVQFTADPKFITVANGLAGQLVNNNIEAAYNRMGEEYRLFVSLEDYTQEWKSYTQDLGSCVKSETPFASNVNKTYTTVSVPYTFEKSTLYANYIFSGTNIFPIGVTYSSKNPDFSETLPKNLPLRELCKDYFKIGFGINGYTMQNSGINCPGFMELGAQQFSSCTLTNLMKPSSVLDQQRSEANAKNGNNEPVLNFRTTDIYLQWCADNNLKMRGHTLVWHTQTPDWFFREGYSSKGALVSREVMIDRLDSYIRQYLTHIQEKFPGVVYCWDVVNEAVDPSAGDQDSPFRCRINNDKEPNQWYFTIGNDYPEVSFRIARKYAAEGVSLFYNDYGTCDRTKRQYIYTLCSDLAEKGLIDGIGMQGYWDNKNPGLKTIAETINLYAQTGLEIQLTEWTIPALTENEQDLALQAERYASVFRLLQKLDTQGGGKANITAVTFFGLMDHYPKYQNDKTNSRLFDGKFQPKPVFYSIQDTFADFYK